MKYKLLRLWYKLRHKTPADMDMVSYWMTNEAVQAKVMKHRDGFHFMKLEGEKYPVMAFPRGFMLVSKDGKYTPFSRLKHEIKNRVFNDAWWKLEEGVAPEVVIRSTKESLFKALDILDEMKYDMLPYEGYCPVVKEIYRAFATVAETLPEEKKAKVLKLRDAICLIMQEDDAYRFRVQDLSEYFNPNSLWQKLARYVTHKGYLESIRTQLGFALTMVENCEVTEDMKIRIRLLRRIVLLGLDDPEIGGLFEKLSRVLNWKKIFLTAGDRYNFRGKYYKTDYRIFEY